MAAYDEAAQAVSDGFVRKAAAVSGDAAKVLTASAGLARDKGLRGAVRKHLRRELGWPVDHDQTVSEEIRFVQVTPPGSAASVAFGKGLSEMKPGSLRAIQVVVDSADAALADLKERGVDADEARALRDLSAARGLLVMEAMWTRYLPHMVRIRELVAEGRLGTIRQVRAQYLQDWLHDADAPMTSCHHARSASLAAVFSRRRECHCTCSRAPTRTCGPVTA